MNFIRFNPTTGHIIDWGRCQDCDFPTENAIEGSPTGRGCVLNGEFVAYTAEELASIDSMPATGVWDNFTMTWTDTRSLSELKAAKWDALKVERLARETAPLSYLETTFDADFASQQKINGAVTLALMSGSLTTMDWTDANNNTVTLTKVELLGLGAALGQRTSDIYSQARALRTQVESATSVEELNAVNWV